MKDLEWVYGRTKDILGGENAYMYTITDVLKVSSNIFLQHNSAVYWCCLLSLGCQNVLIGHHYWEHNMFKQVTTLLAVLLEKSSIVLYWDRGLVVGKRLLKQPWYEARMQMSKADVLSRLLLRLIFHPWKLSTTFKLTEHNSNTINR